MTRDNDLLVSCRCGKLTITKLDGYLTSDLMDAAELGLQAERLCRRKRLRKWVLSLGLPLIAGAILIAGTGWWAGGKQKMDTVKAEEWSWRAERYLAEGDYRKAADAWTKAIEHHPTVRSYLSRAFCYDELGKLEEAVEDCGKAVTLDPKSGAARRSLANIQERLK